MILCQGMIRWALPEMRTPERSIPRCLEAVQLLDQHLRVEHDAGAQHAQGARPENAARHQPQLVGLVAEHERVAGVVASLVAGDDVGPLGEQVDDLALALVAPLGADDHRAGHGYAAPRAMFANRV